MASASSSSARTLFAESRAKLVERVAGNVEACGSVCRQVVRGSRSHDTLLAAARATAAQVRGGGELSGGSKRSAPKFQFGKGVWKIHT